MTDTKKFLQKMILEATEAVPLYKESVYVWESYETGSRVYLWGTKRLLDRAKRAAKSRDLHCVPLYRIKWLPESRG